MYNGIILACFIKPFWWFFFIFCIHILMSTGQKKDYKKNFNIKSKYHSNTWKIVWSLRSRFGFYFPPETTITIPTKRCSFTLWQILFLSYVVTFEIIFELFVLIYINLSCAPIFKNFFCKETLRTVKQNTKHINIYTWGKF